MDEFENDEEFENEMNEDMEGDDFEIDDDENENQSIDDFNDELEMMKKPKRKRYSMKFYFKL